MECFIKKIFEGNADEQVHRQFVRFSRGSFLGRAALNLVKKDRIKLGGSFEFANDFVNLASELGDARFSGIILNRSEVSDLGAVKKKNSLSEYNVQDISSEKIKEIKNSYSMLLDADGQGFSLKMKKKLPKPGKSGELKIDDKFCILEADLRYWDKIKDFFMLPDCSRAKISHVYIIDEVVVDRNEKDFSKMRESARKRGKIVRKMIVDGQEIREEKSFEA